MERAAEISRGAISLIYTEGATHSYPVVQVVELKKITQQSAPSANAAPRYRLAISDGTHFQQAMLATQLNNLIAQETLALNTLVKLKDFICNDVQGKRIVIILSLDIIAQLPGKVGNPVGVDTAGGPTRTPPPPPQGVQQSGGGFGGAGTHGSGGAWNAAPPQQAPQKQYGGAPNGYQAAMVKPEMRGGGPYNSGRPGSTPGTGGIMARANPAKQNVHYNNIQSINPYQNGWTIRGRCTYKSDIRSFQSSRGPGKVISFELTDESGSIRVTGFTSHADQVAETVHLNRIYSVTRASLKPANEKYNRSTSSFEMTLDVKSHLEEIQDDGSFLKIKYDFTKIANLESIDVKGTCDVLGVVTEVGPLSEIIIRSTGDPCTKRSVTICDDSNASVELTLWRTQAETFLTEPDAQRRPVLLMKNASRGDFGGVCLNVSRMTTMELDPVNVPEANLLRAWADSGGLNGGAIQSLTSGPGGGGGKIMGDRKCLAEAKAVDVDPVFNSGMNNGDGHAQFIMRGMISFVSQKGEISYPSDPANKKKVIQLSPGLWSSESTGQQLTDEEVQHRYILNMKVADHSDAQWMSAFDESGTVLFARSAGEMRTIKESDPNLFEYIVEDCTFRPMLMKIQVKGRQWKNEQQIRYTISRCEMLDFASEGNVLLKEIASYQIAG